MGYGPCTLAAGPMLRIRKLPHRSKTEMLIRFMTNPRRIVRRKDFFLPSALITDEISLLHALTLGSPRTNAGEFVRIRARTRVYIAIRRRLSHAKAGSLVIGAKLLTLYLAEQARTPALYTLGLAGKMVIGFKQVR